MSIESFTPLAATSPISEYIALADQHAFVYTWLVLKPGYIEVFINDIKKALHIDYTVTGIGEPLGGVVNINLSINILDGDKISIKRVTKIERLSGYSYLGSFNPNTINTDILYLLCIAQELKRDMSLIGTGLDTIDVLSRLNNLSDLDNSAIARNNLDVYSKGETDLLNPDSAGLALQISDNLSDVADVIMSRTNLEVYSKTETDNIPYDLAFAKKIRKANISVGDTKLSCKASDHDGWVLGDGRELLRTHELFSACGGVGQIGFLIGAGNGSTTFNIPNFNGYTLGVAGQFSGGTVRYLGQSVGAEEENIQDYHIPKHRHKIAKHTWVSSNDNQLNNLSAPLPNVMADYRNGGNSEDAYRLSGLPLLGNEPDTAFSGSTIVDELGVDKEAPTKFNKMQPTKFLNLFVWVGEDGV